jgi:hypothetical protein
MAMGQRARGRGRDRLRPGARGPAHREPSLLVRALDTFGEEGEHSHADRTHVVVHGSHACTLTTSRCDTRAPRRDGLDHEEGRFLAYWSFNRSLASHSPLRVAWTFVHVDLSRAMACSHRLSICFRFMLHLAFHSFPVFRASVEKPSRAGCRCRRPSSPPGTRQLHAASLRSWRKQSSSTGRLVTKS